jgi:hypothetical protein
MCVKFDLLGFQKQNKKLKPKIQRQFGHILMWSVCLMLVTFMFDC